MKYTIEEIKEKAIAFLTFHEHQGPRAPFLLAILSQITNTSPDECMSRIKQFAQ